VPALLVGRELLVGAVADGGDEPWCGVDLVEGPRDRGGQVEARRPGRGACAGGDSLGGMGSGTQRNPSQAISPEGRGELGAGGVVGADEQHPTLGDLDADPELVEGLATEPDVTAAPVPGGHVPLDEPRLLEDAEMVGEEIRSDPAAAGQLGGGAVRRGEVVDDGEAHGVPESGEASGVGLSIHAFRLVAQGRLTQLD